MFAAPEWKYHSQLDNKNKILQSVSLNAIEYALLKPLAYIHIAMTKCLSIGFLSLFSFVGLEGFSFFKGDDVISSH